MPNQFLHILLNLRSKLLIVAHQEVQELTNEPKKRSKLWEEGLRLGEESRGRYTHWVTGQYCMSPQPGRTLLFRLSMDVHVVIVDIEDTLEMVDTLEKKAPSGLQESTTAYKTGRGYGQFT